MKNGEIPRIINILLGKITNSETFKSFNNHMRSAEEILKDYGLKEVK